MDFLYRIFAGVLNELYSMTGNFGLAIIGITVLVKLVTLPLTLKQDKSMRAMKNLQPEIDAIKSKHKDDPKMVNQKTMELYQEKKINPAAGCLPLIIQMPILFALFGVLRVDAAGNFVYLPEISGNVTFLWMTMNVPDQFYILPVLNGIFSFLQQKLTGSADTNPQMKNMMYMFPIMMIFISYKMPAGLQVYWVVSSLAGIAQQYWIIKKGEKKN